MKKRADISIKIAVVSGVSAVLFLYGMFFSVLLYAAEEVLIPVITVSPDVYYPPDEILYIEGRTAPRTAIQLQFQKSGVKPVVVNTKSDANGEWVFAEKIPLAAGDWEVRARLANSAGVTSAWSNPRVFKAVATGIALGGGLTIKYSLLLFLFLVVLAFSAAFSVYAFSRMRKFQAQTQLLRVRKLQKELHEKDERLRQIVLEKGKEEAEAVVKKSFEQLQESITQELRHLETLSGNRSLSPEEVEHRELLRADLAHMAEKIELRIKNIDQND